MISLALVLAVCSVRLVGVLGLWGVFWGGVSFVLRVGSVLGPGWVWIWVWGGPRSVPFLLVWGLAGWCSRRIQDGSG